MEEGDVIWQSVTASAPSGSCPAAGVGQVAGLWQAYEAVGDGHGALCAPRPPPLLAQGAPQSITGLCKHSGLGPAGLWLHTPWR